MDDLFNIKPLIKEIKNSDITKASGGFIPSHMRNQLMITDKKSRNGF